MGFRASILIILSLLSGLNSFSQDKSNRGKEFWLGYGYNWIFDNENPQNSQELILYLSTDAPANVTVSVTNTGWSQTVSIPANTVDVSIKIPKTGANDARIFNEGLFNRGVHIVSDTPIVVFAHTFNTMISAATMLMPVETYGYKYFSLNYSQSQSGSSPPNPPINTTQNGPSWYSWFFVVAAEDNTRLEITPSDTTRNGWLPTQTYTVNLNKGEIYNVMGKLGAGNKDWEASKDMTGSKVLSVPGADGNCHPIAFFSGSGGIRLCKNDGGENMQQQVFPTQAWGTRYLTYHTLNNTTTNINDPFKNFYRVAVSDPTTVVKRNGIVLTGLIKNFYYEFLDSTGGDFIEADKPILMAQYTPGGNRCYLASQFAYGDPEMFYLSPLEQGKKDVLFYANRNSFIDYNYLNLIVSNAGLNSLRLDGNPFDPANTKPHPNHPGYSVAVARIPGAAAQHRLTCDSIFTGTMYGLGFFESYGYNVGTFINNLNNYIQIQNTLNTNGQVDTFTCPKTPVRLYAKFASPANSIHWKLSQVPGIFPNTDSIITNPVPVRTETINGRAYYVYTLQQDFTFASPGTYQIPVSYSAPIIENCNQTENAFLNVLVKDGPKADFSTSNQLCLADTVRFTGTTPANGLFNYTSYLWNFDDASTQNTINAKKRFASTGPHDIRYRVYADNGCIGDTIKTVNIVNGTGPQVSLAVTGNACKDSVLTFTSSIPFNAGNPTTWYWDFGGGQTVTSTTSNVTNHNFGTAGINVPVRHSVTLTNGCQPDTISYIIPVINPTPVASFTLSGNLFCKNEPILFSSAATGVTTWSWDFGNGTGNNVPPFTRSFNTAGIKTIQLSIKDNNGCGSLPITNSVTIIETPLAKFGFDRNICVGDSIRFSDSSSTTIGTIASWKWHFGDGNIATYTNNNPFYHPYSSPGTYSVALIVTSSNGCISDTFRLPVTVNNKPLASISSHTGVPCIDSLRNFTSSYNTGSPTTWYWDFGDGQTFTSSTIHTTSHAYTTALNNITVKHAVDLGGGCRSDTAIITIPVIHPNPVASFTLSGNAFCKNEPILFSSATTGVTTWNWDFGNGTGNNVPPFSRAYTTAGVKNIQLTIKDVNGCGSLPASNTVTVIEAPLAKFGFDRNICIGDSIRFSDSSSTTIGTITSWQWNFGDGNSVTFNNNNPFYHPYSNAGNYPVYLIATSSNGCVSDTFRLPVTVNSKPTATFNYIGKPCIDSVLSFTSSVPTGGTNPPTWIWNFGDLQTFSSGTSNIASHAYSSALTSITVKHLVDLGGGCRSDTATVTIPVIHPNPVAAFSLGGTVFCQNEPILFSASTAGITNWNWDFGNGTGTNVPPFSRTYNAPGPNTIVLTVKDVNGCGSLPVSNAITVNPAPAISAGPDKFIKLGSSTTLDAAITNPANYDFLWSPSMYLSSSVLLNPVSTPDRPMTYTIQATDKLTNCTASSTVIVTPVSDIYIPNSFTPNNDGKNDKWVIPGLALYPEAVVSVYNRGGQKIFESKAYISNAWNGTINGIVQSTGVYVYLIQLNDDKKQLYKGTVAIIK